MSSPHTPATERPLGQDILYAIRYYLGGRRGLIALGAVAIVGGLAFNWSWLAAIGVAPLLVAMAPCLVMCALGVCMHKMSSGCSHAAHTTGSTADRPGGVDLSWMRREDLTAALPPIAARDDKPEMPLRAAANDSRPVAAASCCSPTERS